MSNIVWDLVDSARDSYADSRYVESVADRIAREASEATAALVAAQEAESRRVRAAAAALAAAQAEEKRKVEEKQKADAEYARVVNKLDAYVSAYKTGTFLTILPTIVWEEFRQELAVARGRAISPERTADFKLLELVLIHYTNLVRGHLKSFTVSEKESLAILLELAKWLNLPKLNGQRVLGEVIFTDCASEAKQTVSALATIYQHVTTLSIANSQLNAEFLAVCGAAKQEAGVDCSLENLNLTRVGATPELLSQALTLLPSTANRVIELDAKGLCHVKAGPAATENSLTFSGADSKEAAKFLSLLPSGKPKNLIFKDNAYPKELFLEDGDVTALEMHTNNMFLSSFSEDGAFPKLLKGLPKLRVLKLNNLTFVQADARTPCLRAIFTHQPALEVLELRNFGLKEEQQNELLAYLKANKKLTTLDLRGNALTPQFLAELEEVVVHSESDISNIVTDAVLPKNLSTALARNRDKVELEKSYRLSQAFIEKFEAVSDAKEVISSTYEQSTLYADFLRQVASPTYNQTFSQHTDFITGYKWSVAHVKCFYPTPEKAALLQDQYHKCLPKMFEKWMAAAAQQNITPEERVHCHFNAFELLQQENIPVELQNAIFEQYLQSDFLYLARTQNTPETINYLVQVYKFLVKHPKRNLALLAYEAISTLKLVAQADEMMKQIAGADALIDLLPEGERKAAAEKLLRALGTIDNLDVANFAIAMAKKRQVRVEECCITYLNRLKNAVSAAGTGIEEAIRLHLEIKKVLRVVSACPDSTQRQLAIFIGHAGILEVVERYLKNSFSKEAVEAKAESKSSGKQEAFYGSGLMKSLLDLLPGAQKLKAQTLLLELFKRDALALIAEAAKVSKDKVLSAQIDKGLSNLAHNIQKSENFPDLHQAIQAFSGGIFGAYKDLRKQLQGLNSAVAGANTIILNNKLGGGSVSSAAIFVPSAPPAGGSDASDVQVEVKKELSAASGELSATEIAQVYTSAYPILSGAAASVSSVSASDVKASASADSKEEKPVHSVTIEQRLKTLATEAGGEDKRDKLLSAEIEKLGYMDLSTQHIMRNPVLAADGRSYERQSIVNWMAKSTPWRSMYKNTEHMDKHLVPNEELGLRIIAYLDEKISAVRAAKVSEVTVGESASPSFELSPVASAPVRTTVGAGGAGKDSNHQLPSKAETAVAAPKFESKGDLRKSVAAAIQGTSSSPATGAGVAATAATQRASQAAAPKNPPAERKREVVLS